MYFQVRAVFIKLTQKNEFHVKIGPSSLFNHVESPIVTVDLTIWQKIFFWVSKYVTDDGPNPNIIRFEIEFGYILRFTKFEVRFWRFEVQPMFGRIFSNICRSSGIFGRYKGFKYRFLLEQSSCGKFEVRFFKNRSVRSSDKLGST